MTQLDPRLLGLVLCAAGVLLFFLLWRRRVRNSRRAASHWVVIDGSNVMYWKDGIPQIQTVRAVVRHLSAMGYTPGVMFDANAGYLLIGKYTHDHAFGKLLGLPEDHIMVVPKGTPADPAILQAARDLGGPVVTNDRFRDWADSFPEVGDPKHLIRGGYRSGTLWLNLANPARAEHV